VNDSPHPIARDYLKRLRKAARRLPRARRKELIEEIEAHLHEALPPGTGEDEARDVLERLGEPAQIAAAGRGEGCGPLEWITIFALFSGVGWVIGVVLLLLSRAWTDREKSIGLLLMPGGLLPALFVMGGVAQVCQIENEPATRTHAARTVTQCTPYTPPVGRDLLILIFIVLLILPVVGAAYLSKRARRSRIATS
jgi:hypothetical protein